MTAQQGATPPTPDELRAELTAAFGTAVTGADIYGRGPSAIVDVIFGDGGKMTFERYSDITKPTALATYLATHGRGCRAFKGPEALAIAGAIHALAKHHAESTDDDHIRECATEFLRVAPAFEADLQDQAERWRAFSVLAGMNPARDGGEDRSALTIAANSTVLVDKSTGKRLVRTGWFQQFVKREHGGIYSPAILAIRAERIGWTQPNGQGRIKATNPMDSRQLAWAFYIVEADWEGGQVTASYSSYAHAPARARGLTTPAVTRNPEAVSANADIEPEAVTA